MRSGPRASKVLANLACEPSPTRGRVDPTARRGPGLTAGRDMGSNRLPYFPFHAWDWVTDEAVAGMSAEAEGCYIRLLARSWMSGTPGVVPVGLVNELGGLYRVNGRSTDVQQELERAFDTESRPGYWVQDRMVREWERATAVSEAGRKAGLASVEARKSNKLNGRPTVVEQSFNQGEVEVDLEVKESKSTTSSPDGSGRRAKGVKKQDNPKDREWMETFDEVWWPDYWSLGRKCSKAAAREVWAKIPHGDGQADFDRLSSSFDEAKADWRVTRSEPRFIPHAEKWLRDYLKNLILEA